jgi:glycerol-3-phosphate acyltransferase PlsY
MPERLACLAIGYAFGCILTAEVVCRHVTHGSAFDLGIGNPGMANVSHELGIRWGMVTLAGDIAKTLAATLVCWATFPGSQMTCALWAGLGATLGHEFPVWHHFRGGKGVTTTCSCLVLASPAWGLLSCVVGAGAVLLTKRLCVGAIAITAAWLAHALVTGDVDAIVVGLALTALMLRAHMPAVLGIRTGETPETDLLAKLRDLRG